ncbi:MAG: hypothetical protein AB7O26_12985 [Planctomycetaceae bacterium]
MLAFTAAYMGAALVALLRSQNPEFAIYLIVMLVLIILVTAVHLRTYLHIATRWCLSLWGLAHMAGGLIPIPEGWPRSDGPAVLYNLWIVVGVLKYDQVVHAFGSAVATWSCWQALHGAFHHRGVKLDRSFGLISLCFAAGIGFGAANETLEFLATLVLPRTNVGDYANTGWDLIANFVGASLVAVALITLKPSSADATQGPTP